MKETGALVRGSSKEEGFGMKVRVEKGERQVESIATAAGGRCGGQGRTTDVKEESIPSDRWEGAGGV